MAKGYHADRERKEELAALGKILAKRAGFACEWCGGKDDLRPHDFYPAEELAPDNAGLLCGRCREAAGGSKLTPQELRNVANAVWSPCRGVAEGVATLLAASGEPWAREMVEDSLIDARTKEQLLR